MENAKTKKIGVSAEEHFLIQLATSIVLSLRPLVRNTLVETLKEASDKMDLEEDDPSRLG